MKAGHLKFPTFVSISCTGVNTESRVSFAVNSLLHARYNRREKAFVCIANPRDRSFGLRDREEMLRHAQRSLPEREPIMDLGSIEIAKPVPKHRNLSSNFRHVLKITHSINTSNFFEYISY